jgi:hypothetical protein
MTEPEQARKMRIERDAATVHLRDVMASIGAPDQWAAIRAARRFLDTLEHDANT